jgi:hypothetical protein
VDLKVPSHQFPPEKNVYLESKMAEIYKFHRATDAEKMMRDLADEHPDEALENE